MHRYLIEASIVFVVGIVVIAAAAAFGAIEFERHHLVRGGFFWLVASALIPARTAIQRKRVQDSIARRSERETFE